MPPLAGEWLNALQGEFKKPYYHDLFQTINEEYQTKRIFLRRTTFSTHFILRRWIR